MTILYNGWAMKALRADLMPRAIIVPDTRDDEAPATQGPADGNYPKIPDSSAQAPLMVLPAHVVAQAVQKVKRRGHAMPPGTGPEGKTCGGCAHLVRKAGAARNFLKCGLARERWTGGAGSDVRAKDAACSKFNAKGA